MSRIEFTTTPNGWIVSNSKEVGTSMGRTTTCKGCGYKQNTIMPQRYDARLWRETHTLEFCRERKARIAQLDFTKLGNHIRNQEILNSLN